MIANFLDISGVAFSKLVPAVELGLRYHVKDEAITIHNGDYFNNRPLYCAHTPGWVLTGDRPQARFAGDNYMLGCMNVAVLRNGQGKWLHEWNEVVAQYRSGRMEWTVRDVSLPGVSVTWEVVPFSGRPAFATRLVVRGQKAGDQLVCSFGGMISVPDVSSKWDPVILPQHGSDSGELSPVLRQVFQPADCRSNQVAAELSGFSVSTTLTNTSPRVVGRCSLPVKTVVADAADWSNPVKLVQGRARDLPMACGTLELTADTQEVFWVFEAVGVEKVNDSFRLREPQKAFAEALAKAEAVARQVVVETPDRRFDLGVSAAGHALNAVFYPPVYRHGAMAWNYPYPGWRTVFGGTAFGWHDRVLAQGRCYVNSQVKESTNRVAHSDARMGYSQEAKNSRFYGRGRIVRDQYFYNFQSQLFDQLIHAWRWTGDKEMEQVLRDGLELHLEWARDCFDPDDDGLYESYINTWPTDSVWYNGGGSVEETAYAYRGHLAAADLAHRAGDAGREKSHWQRAEKLQRALRQKLWVKEHGHPAAYIEQGGHQRRHEDAWLYSVFLPIDMEMLTLLEAAQALHYTEWGLERVKLPYGGQRCWTSNWLPSMWSARVLYPGDNYHLALAYFQTGMPTEGWELLQGNFLESMYAGVVPGGLASANSSTDFTDIVSIFCRTVVEGLFGYRPNYPNGMVRCAPQFPVSWNHASIATPDFKLRFKQDGNADRYDLELSQPAEVEFMIPARAKMVAGVEVNGQAVDYQIEPGFGQSVLRLRTAKLGLVQLQVRLKSRQPMAEAIQIAGEVGQVVNFPDAAPANKYQDPQGALQEVHLDKNALVGKLAENPGHHILVVQTGELPQWQSYKLTITDPCSEKSRHDKTEVKVPADAQWTCLDLTPKFNGDIRTIYQQQYLSPRPATCSVRLGADGYSPWTFYYWKMTPPPIDLTQVSALLSARGDQLMTPQGVPFRWSGLSNNVAFTSLWDNWPKSISVPVGKSAQAVWLLICGSSNPMQTHVANAEVRMRYSDGSEEKLELIPPINYWSLCPLGGRDYPHPADVFCLPATPPPTVQLGGNCRAMVLPWKLKPACKLESITLESLSQEVVVGLMGITLLN